MLSDQRRKKGYTPRRRWDKQSLATGQGTRYGIYGGTEQQFLLADGKGRKVTGKMGEEKARDNAEEE